MTPKEKAEDLWVTFYQLLPDGIYSDYAAKEEARKFSLIAVDELITAHNGMKDFLFSEIGYLITSPEYWQEVKQEIEKL